MESSVRGLAWQVVACHKGSACVAGPGGSSSQPRMVDGRLWLYNDGDIAFLFLEGLEFLIDLRRIDHDLH
jgi:hypothetical protein